MDQTVSLSRGRHASMATADEFPHSCAVANGPVSLDMCKSLTATFRNQAACRSSRCNSSARACTSCLRQGSLPYGVVVDVMTGLCKFHSSNGAEKIRTKEDIQMEALDLNWSFSMTDTSRPVEEVQEVKEAVDTIEADAPAEEPAKQGWYTVVERYHAAQKDTSLPTVSVLEISDAVAAMRAEGKAHKEIAELFQGSRYATVWSSQIYSLQRITPEARARLIDLGSMPISWLVQLAYRPCQEQCAFVDSLPARLQAKFDRKEEVLTERVLRRWGLCTREVLELKSLLQRRVSKPKTDEDALLSHIDRLMALLTECKVILAQ